MASWDEAHTEVKVRLGLIFPGLTISKSKTDGPRHLTVFLGHGSLLEIQEGEGIRRLESETQSLPRSLTANGGESFSCRTELLLSQC